MANSTTLEKERAVPVNLDFGSEQKLKKSIARNLRAISPFWLVSRDQIAHGEEGLILAKGNIGLLNSGVTNVAIDIPMSFISAGYAGYRYVKKAKFTALIRPMEIEITKRPSDLKGIILRSDRISSFYELINSNVADEEGNITMSRPVRSLVRALSADIRYNLDSYKLLKRTDPIKPDPADPPGSRIFQI